MKLFDELYLLRKAFCFFIPIVFAVQVSAQLNANFTATIQQGCSPLVVQFNDVSTGSPTQWLWDFGNGNTSTKQNPQAVYIDAKNYTITLTVKNASGENTTVKKRFYRCSPKSCCIIYCKPNRRLRTLKCFIYR